ncbi:endo-polygalacturonase [Sarracenia purpurea var. burkii]
MFHIVLDNCQNVKVQGVIVLASGSSPNTDGIHMQNSSGVTIGNSRIATGDDCISIGPGNSNLTMENVTCWELQEPGVQNVTVSRVTFTGTKNGVRIKTWGRPSNGFVRGVVFQHLRMVNVQNPIIIDQNYCPHSNDCPGQYGESMQWDKIGRRKSHVPEPNSGGIVFKCRRNELRPSRAD